MHGVIFQILECYVIEHHGGKDTWHAIKSKANCTVADNGFLPRSYYPDSDLLDLVQAAADLLGAPVDTVLDLFGHYFGYYAIHRHGAEDMLECQGTSLRSWLSNLNAMHDHIQMSFPGGSSKSSKFMAPVFWCEDCDPGEDNDNNEGPEEEEEEAILLHYYSSRGTLFVPMVPAIVKEIASWRFDLDVEFTLVNLQGGDDKGNKSKFTTWKINAINKEDSWKLTGSREAAPSYLLDNSFSVGDKDHQHNKRHTTSFATTRSHRASRRLSSRRSSAIPTTNKFSKRKSSIMQSRESRCPFTGLKRTTMVRNDSAESLGLVSAASTAKSEDDNNNNNPLVFEEDDEELKRLYEFEEKNDAKLASLGITVVQMQAIFPFHIILDKDFTILNVGNSLPTVLLKDREDFLGKHVGEVMEISRPVLEEWNWKELKKLADQSFFIVPAWSLDCSLASAEAAIEFKGSLFPVGVDDAVMLVMSPNIRNVQELRTMGLCMTDLPLHGNQRDSVFLGEYITQEVERAQELDLLSRKLQLEKDTSNALLNNMLPAPVAEELRNGGTAEPKHYENVTLFFSDVVGFTAICAEVDPWDVIDMLNQLYSVMDYLAEKFDIYKVETIGDAYMACSGLPTADEFHAENIANFAIAVMECVQLVKSPIDNETPLQLRVGIHTGECTAGVVGTKTPHYCLFGDTVNVAARHEQTGQPGKIQSSSEMFGRLRHDSKFDKQQFRLTPRGLIDMKGKGNRYTYWLDNATNDNEHVCPAAMAALKWEVSEMLQSRAWKIRKYFSRTSGALRGIGRQSLASTEDTAMFSDSTIHPDGEEVLDLMQDNNNDTQDNRRRSQSMASDDDRTVEMNNSNHPFADASDRNLDSFDVVVGGYKVNNDSTIQEEEHCPLHHHHHHPSTVPNCSFDDLVFQQQGREALVSNVYDILHPLLKLCMLQHDSGTPTASMDVLGEQLRGFIDRISLEFRQNHNPYHSFLRTAHVVAWSNHLFERLQDSDAGHSGMLDPSSWYRLALTMAALIRDCKHLGVNDQQLQREGHFVFQMHGGSRRANASSCQAKYSLTFGLELLEEEFPDLFGELRFGCPSFLYLTRKAALMGDPQTEFQTAMKLPIGRQQHMTQRTEATLALVMKLTDLGYFTLKYDNFKGWLEALFAEKRLASLGGRGKNPLDTWGDDCVKLCNEQVLPLIRLCQSSFPEASGLEAKVVANLSALSEESHEMAKKGLFPRRKSFVKQQ